MGDTSKIVRSPWSTGRGAQRSDQGHVAPHVGKGGLTNPKLMRGDQNAPVQGDVRGVIDEEKYLGPKR